MTARQLAEVIGVRLKAVDAALAAAVDESGMSVQGRRGVSRTISLDDSVLLAAAFLLCRDLGCPIGRGIEIARMLVDAKGTARVSALMEVSVDLSQLRDLVERTAADVVAGSPPPRRGRPPKKNRGAP